MDAEPTPTRGIPARARLAAVRGRLRELAGGALRRPAVRRAVVVGGLALTGWLLGTGAGAWAADVPNPSTHNPHATLGDPVRDHVSQARSLVHAGSDAVGRTETSLDRHPLRADGPGVGHPVGDHVSQARSLVHAGSDAVGRTETSLDRHPLRADGPGVGHPVGDHVSQARSLVHAGSDAVGRTQASLDRHPLDARAGRDGLGESVRGHAGRVARTVRGDSGEVRRSAGSVRREARARVVHRLVRDGRHAAAAAKPDRLRRDGRHAVNELARHDVARDARDGAARALSRDSVDRAATALVRGAGKHVHGVIGRRASRDDVRRIASPVGSLLGSGADRVRRALPVPDALGGPSSVVDSMTGQIRHTGGRLTDRVAGQAWAATPGAYEAADGSRAAAGASLGDRAITHTARHVAGSAHPSTTARGGQAAPASVHMITAHLMCAQSEFACGHAGVRHPHAPGDPAPVGPQPGTHGMVPSPVSGGGQPLPGAGDVTWIGTDRIPHRLAVIAPRRGVLPPVVRTAADEPSLSPD